MRRFSTKGNHDRSVIRRARFIAAGVVGLLIVGTTVAAAVPLPSPDPCDSLVTGAITTAQAQQYEKCRFDRIETAVPVVTSTVTAPPVTSTVTPRPATSSVTAPPVTSTVTVTATQSSSTALSTTNTAVTTTPKTGTIWPDATNTGVPTGTTLTNYSGPMVITVPNTVIDAKKITGDLTINAANVQITRSRIVGRVITPDTSNTYSVTLSDSEVQAGSDATQTAVANVHFKIYRSEITGGNRGVYCSIDCLVQDSWIHGTIVPTNSSAHASGMRASQSTTYRHNRIHCEAIANSNGGGCSADLTMYGDFDPVQNVLIENNLFEADGSSGYCAYGGSSSGKPYSNSANNIVYKDNVFQRGTSGRCGQYGAIVSFDSTRPGNVWTNNRWDDGSILNP